jgi:pimeloyl-ACP methyl ester carboxylesterase
LANPVDVESRESTEGHQLNHAIPDEICEQEQAKGGELSEPIPCAPAQFPHSSPKNRSQIMKINTKLAPALMTKYSASLIGCLLLILTVGGMQARAEWPHVVLSKDGSPISYEIFGTGEPTLVFVHGWSGDARYWRAQVPTLSKKYRVVVLDLAGHGHSGVTRTQYTMNAFGEDVRAATEATGSKKVILIGHSMGGSVIAEAARLMPGRIIGLIGVDTLENIEYPMTQEELKKMLAPLGKDFRTGSRKFVEEMIYPQTDPALREWILSDVSAAPPAVALSAIKEMMTQYITGEAAKIFEQIRIPVVTVNGDLWPINYEANRRHMFSYDAIVLKKADHFLMMNRPDEFNQALEKAILMLSGQK